MSFVVAHDAIHANVGHLPPGQAGGYTTGSKDIKWTSLDWAAHPFAVRIDQDFAASDPSADVLDVERGAATPAECPRWVKQAEADFAKVARQGQRHPAIYMSQSTVSTVCNALIAGGVRSGVGLWVANWNLSEAQAVAEVLSASGPFPIIGIQWTDAAGFYDNDVFSQAWLQDVAGGTFPASPPPTLMQGDQGTWVSAAQHDLNAKGVLPVLAVDGDFGPKTFANVEEFQRQQHLVVDGIIGPHTWAALTA